MGEAEAEDVEADLVMESMEEEEKEAAKVGTLDLVTGSALAVASTCLPRRTNTSSVGNRNLQVAEVATTIVGEVATMIAREVAMVTAGAVVAIEVCLAAADPEICPESWFCAKNLKN